MQTHYSRYYPTILCWNKVLSLAIVLLIFFVDTYLQLFQKVIQCCKVLFTFMPHLLDCKKFPCLWPPKCQLTFLNTLLHEIQLCHTQKHLVPKDIAWSLNLWAPTLLLNYYVQVEAIWVVLPSSGHQNTLKAIQRIVCHSHLVHQEPARMNHNLSL